MKEIYYKQETIWTCGAAAMRIALAKLGIMKSEKEIINLLKTNKIRGTYHKNFPEAAEKLKLNYIVKRDSTINDIKKISRDYIIIICYFIKMDKVDHYAVVNKLGKNYIYLLDPYYGNNYKLKLSNFIKDWKSDSRWENENRWLFAISKKTKGEKNGKGK